MSLIDRFTRDRASKVVWGLASILLAGTLAASIVLGDQARDEELARASDRAGRSLTAFGPTLEGLPLDGELEGDTLATAQAGATPIASSPTVIALRIWDLDGFLLFSTDGRDHVGSAEIQNDEELALAGAGGSQSLSRGQDTPELHTYAYLSESEVIGEIVQSTDAVVVGVDALWGPARIATGFGLALVLLLLILSFRPSVARIGAGVPFVGENAPPGMALVDEDRLRAVNDVYALAQERVDKLKERLRTAESDRQYLQGELQRALSGFAPAPAASTDPSAIPPAVAPDPKPRSPRKRQVEPVAPKIAPAASAEPVVVPEVTAVPAEPTPEAAELLAAAAEVGEVVEAASGRAARDDVIEIPESEVVAPSMEREAAAVGAWSYPGVPEVAALREDTEEGSQSAREVLDRLMASEVHEIGGADADPGRIREQIARVAAKKKPGGGEARKLFLEPEGPKPPWMRNRDS